MSSSKDKKTAEERMEGFKAFLIKNRSLIENSDIISSHSLPFDRLVTLALRSASMNPAILDCEPASILSALSQAAILGLEFDTVRAYAYLLTRKKRFIKGGKEIWGTELQFMPSYKGLIHLASRSNVLDFIEARIVYSDEHFLMHGGTNSGIEHIINPLPAIDRQIIGVYAVARLQNTSHIKIEFMNMNQINEIRKNAKVDTVWVKFFEEMAKKTVIRRLFKTLDVGEDFDLALKISAISESGGRDLFTEPAVEVVETRGLALLDKEAARQKMLAYSQDNNG